MGAEDEEPHCPTASGSPRFWTATAAYSRAATMSTFFKIREGLKDLHLGTPRSELTEHGAHRDTQVTDTAQPAHLRVIDVDPFKRHDRHLLRPS